MTKNVKTWVLAFGIAVAGLIGGAAGVTATTAEDAPLGRGYELASHEEDNEDPRDEAGGGKKDDKGKKSDKNAGKRGGDSSDKGDKDSSDAGDTDGPGDDEDD